MTIVIASVFLLYFILMIVLMIGWNKAMLQKPASGLAKIEFPVTIVIAARNEEHTIGLLLADISRQRHKSFDVIIVDDHSEDGTVDAVWRHVEKDKRFFLKHCDGVGKKQALAEGIQMAKGSVIVTTDADCRVSENWLVGLSSNFSDQHIKMVFGGVGMSGGSLFSQLQSMEFLSLTGSGGAMASLGLPTLCNGANLAFRKSVFDEVEGYDGNLHIPSGDDEFLMRKIAIRYPKGVKFAANRESIVTTSTNAGIQAFMNQRIRWAGKWRVNRSFPSKALALFILTFQVSFLSLPVWVVTGTIDFVAGALLCLTKVSMEFFFLRSIARFIPVSWSWTAFILLQFIYPFYVTLIGLVSNFRSFEWKGRKLRSLMVSRY